MQFILTTFLKGVNQMIKVRRMSEEEINKLIASGAAVQFHLYDSSNVLRPRGHMEKESIGLELLERLCASYESWTDEKYGDNPDKSILIKLLQDNLNEEVQGAFREFLKKINV